MLEVGTVHRKNTKNILVKNIFDAAIGALMWWGVGASLAGAGGDEFVQDGENGFAGDHAFFLQNSTASKTGYAKASWFFGWTFAAAGATIVSGAVAERCSFVGYISYSIVLTGFIYPPVVHMMWSPAGKMAAWRSASTDDDGHGAGRLFGDCGVIDFAGSGTVHLVGGVAALVACAIVGPRQGRFASDPKFQTPAGNPVLQSLGVLILWMGWYGFNCCSTLYIAGFAQSAAHVAMTTTIAAATGCLSTTLLGYAITHQIETNNVNNGVLAGLVAITSPCAVCSPAGAFIIGCLAAPAYMGGHYLMLFLQIDDVVDAIAVHGFCGFLGVICAGCFATPYYYSVSYYGDRKEDCAGLFYGGKASGSFASAWVACGIIISWVGTTMAILFGVLKALNLHRVTPEVEEAGMDDSKHGGRIPDYVEANPVAVAQPSKVGIDTTVGPGEAEA